MEEEKKKGVNRKVRGEGRKKRKKREEDRERKEQEAESDWRPSPAAGEERPVFPLWRHPCLPLPTLLLTQTAKPLPVTLCDVPASTRKTWNNSELDTHVQHIQRTAPCRRRASPSSADSQHTNNLEVERERWR